MGFLEQGWPSVVRLIVLNYNNFSQMPVTCGLDFWVVTAGTGSKGTGGSIVGSNWHCW